MWLESNHIIRLQERGQERWWLQVVSPPGFVTRVIMFSRVQQHHHHHHLHPHDSDPDQGRRGESRAANKGSRRLFNQARRNPFLGPRRTFSLLKVASTDLPLKNILRHYAKQLLTRCKQEKTLLEIRGRLCDCETSNFENVRLQLYWRGKYPLIPHDSASAHMHTAAAAATPQPQLRLINNNLAHTIQRLMQDKQGSL